MAPPSSSTSALILLSFLFLLSLGAAARPCKTLFISYAVSSTGYGIASSGSDVSAAGEHVFSRFFTIHRVIPLRYYSYRSYSSSSAAASAEPAVIPMRIDDPVFPRPVIHGERSFGVSSVRERVRDILAVVAGLLFGVGLGGLASIATYLTCGLINGDHEVGGSRGYGLVEDGDEDGAVESPKKIDYTHRPAVPATPVALLKEGYAVK